VVSAIPAEGERGSVLLLMPVAVLVLLILGGLCVDFGSAYAGQHQLDDAAEAAANDAATRSLDLDQAYAAGVTVLLPGDARRVAEAVVAAKALDRLDARVTEVVVGADGRSVTVTVAGRVPFIFGRALPGRRDGMDVHATVTARAEQT
jgi:Flp pilus assembly protein TadG